MLQRKIQRLLLRIKGELTLGGEITLKGLVKRGLKVGSNCHILPGVKIDSSHCWHIEIGDNVTIAPGVRILAHDASTKMHLGYTRIGQVKIGDNVFIGDRSIILPNVSIGDNTIIGAGSLVNKDIPSNVVAAGNPIQVIATLDDFVAKHREQMERFPCFDASYTLRQGVTPKMKDEMKRRMGEGQGYVL